VRKRVLIVDDEENIRELTRLALEAAGYEVGEAGSGLEAFAVIGGEEPWDAVLLDQKMPHMVGTEVLRRLKVLLPTAPVIMMTAFASVELAVEAMKLGASDFVRKPMTPETLRNALAAALNKTLGPSHIPPENRHLFPPQVTLNGFTIIRGSEIPTVSAQNSNEKTFVVRKPDGNEQKVVVEISPKAVSDVSKFTNSLPINNSFWTDQAEQFLSAFIWNDGNPPTTGRLILKGVNQDVLEMTARKDVGR
jgi:DNA-binding response OmpR family regulator